MRRPRLDLLAGLFVLLLAALATPAAADPSIVGLEAAVRGGQVLLSFGLDDGFDRRLRQRLASGLRTGFVYDLELLRDRKRWFDRGLERARVEATATYDAVDGEYLVSIRLDGELVESRVLRDRAEVEAALTRFVDVPVFVADEALGSRRLLVRARAKIDGATLLGLIPATVVTPWVESSKFRVAGRR